MSGSSCLHQGPQAPNGALDSFLFVFRGPNLNDVTNESSWDTIQTVAFGDLTVYII